MAAPPDSNPESLAYRPHDPQNLTAFNHFYNLDYDHAVQEFEQVLARHPDDPFAVNHFLTATLFRELYRMGVLNTGEYANDTFISAPHRPADPKIKQQINDLVNRALQLEEKRLAANANDVEALYARGVTRAQFPPTPPSLNGPGFRLCGTRWGRAVIMNACLNCLRPRLRPS